MNLVPVSSHLLHAVGYDANTQALRAQFKTKGEPGPVYEYLKVPAETYNALMAAESKGKYFGSYIRNAYEHVRVPSPPEPQAA